MLFHLFYPLSDIYIIFNVFKYITFRSIYAALTSLFLMLFLGPWFIKKMQKLQMGQIIRDDGPKSHLAKAGTPSMGGILIVFSISVSALLWSDLTNHYTWLVLFILVAFAGIGFIDDYRKISRKNTKGLSARGKMALQISFVIVASLALMYFNNWDTKLSLPFFKNIRPDIGYAYMIFAPFVVVGCSNAVNLTDGLDGLAIGPFIVASAVYVLFSYFAGNVRIAEYLQIPFVTGVGELTIFCAAMVGAGIGFLWYNTYPASIFMGDVGSLSLGGALGSVAILVKQEILLVIVGGVFVMEALSVMMQVGYFKLSGGERIFKMAPIHHHFELSGWKEPKVIVRFWIISLILGLIAISTLKLR